MVREENQNPNTQRKQDPKAIGTTVVFWLQHALRELQSHSLFFSNGPCLTLTVTKGSRILVLGWWYSWVLIVVSFPLFILCVAVRLLGKYRFILLVFFFGLLSPTKSLYRYTSFCCTLLNGASQILLFSHIKVLCKCIDVIFFNIICSFYVLVSHLVILTVVTAFCYYIYYGDLWSYYCWNCLGQTLPITWWT